MLFDAAFFIASIDFLSRHVDAAFRFLLPRFRDAAFRHFRHFTCHAALLNCLIFRGGDFRRYQLFAAVTRPLLLGLSYAEKTVRACRYCFFHDMLILRVVAIPCFRYNIHYCRAASPLSR